MNRVLVTGAQGFLGRYLVAALLDRGETEVIGCGRSPALTHSFTHRIRRGAEFILAPLPSSIAILTESRRYRYIQIDILNRMDACLREFQPNTIFHLASALHDEELETLFRTNILGTARLLEAIAASGIHVERVILASSGAVYGEPTELPLREDAPCQPTDVYGVSKLAAEHVAQVLSSRLGVRCIWARLFNLVGSGQDERHVCGRLVSQMAAIARWHAPAVIYAGNLKSTRDYVDIRDAARALVEIASKGAVTSVYNVATGVETPGQEILDSCLQLTALAGKVAVDALPDRPGDIQRHFGDVRRLAGLGFQRRYCLKESLAELISYYLVI